MPGKSKNLNLNLNQAVSNTALAYCVKCKKKCKMSNAKEVTLKNGRKALKGECVNCKVMMFRFLPKTK